MEVRWHRSSAAKDTVDQPQWDREDSLPRSQPLGRIGPGMTSAVTYSVSSLHVGVRVILYAGQQVVQTDGDAVDHSAMWNGSLPAVGPE